MLSLLLAIVALAASEVEAATYSLSSSLAGQSFLDAFEWQAIADPTNGRVNYVSQATAEADGLYTVSGNTLTLRADHTTYLSSTGPGRNSFRLQSYNQYGQHVAIFDVGHMPQGCGTWPAIWSEVGANWPYGGEIDILEGVNDQPPNQSTLHTGSGCTMPSSGLYMTGTTVGTDCDAFDNGNSGCGVKLSDYNSYGPNFNNVGGGWYAVERGATAINIFFWERGSTTIPSQVKYPGGSVDTSTWGEPAATFPDWECTFSSHFSPQNIIINLTFCGDWAGAVYSSSGCPSTCDEYVNDNPSAFSGAYFEFNALNIFLPS